MNSIKIIKRSLLLLVGLFIVAIVLVLIPGVQKRLLETQLAPYVSQISVDYIAINPFSARIDKLTLKNNDLNIHIGHLEGRYSLFKLLWGRLKIYNLVLEDTLIEDFSEPAENPKPSPIPLFPGVFPYLDQGFIIDIGHLSLNASYHSPSAGKINLSLKGDKINELTDNPLSLLTDISELQALPELDHIKINGNIYLNQHLKKAIDAQTTQFRITLQEVHSTPQYINIDLKMAELDEAPDEWDEFYFSDQYNRYIGELVQPESIGLSIRQTDSQDRLLASIDFNGRYNGNNGILQGKLKLHTDRDFLQVLKSIQLPLIASDITADFAYSLISLDGRIDLTDSISIENLKYQSLPERFHMDNRVIAEINKQHLTVNKLSLALTENQQPYIQLNTLQPLDINLDNLPAFVENHQNDLARLQITKLPLIWISDFIPDYMIRSGVLSMGLSISVNNNSLLATTSQPLAINALTLLQEQPAQEVSEKKDAAEPEQALAQADTAIAAQTTETLAARENLQSGHNTQTVKAHTASEQQASQQLVVNNLNLNTHLDLSINKDRLDLNLPDFIFTQGHGERLNALLENSVHLVIGQPLNQEIKDKSVKLDSKGAIHINEILDLPIVSSSFNQPVPEALRLDYIINLRGTAPDWTIEELQTKLLQKESKELLHITSKQAVKLTLTDAGPEIDSQGELLGGYLKNINLAWASPYIENMELSGVLNRIDFSLAAAGSNDYTLDMPDISFLNVSALEFNSKATDEKEKQVLFNKVNLSSRINIHYTPEVISVIYPELTLDQGKSGLLRNKGSVVISDYSRPEKQLIIAQGTLNGFVHNIMNLAYVQELAKKKLNARSLVDAKYHLELTQSHIRINKSDINLHHPETSGSLKVVTLKPVSFALPVSADPSTSDINGSAGAHSGPQKLKPYTFSPDGQLRITLNKFDSKPYENFLADLDIAFDRIDGQLELRQKNARQDIIFKQPLKVSNFYFRNRDTRPLDPFDLELDLQLSKQYSKVTGDIKTLSLQFLEQQEKALDSRMKFKLNMNRDIPVQTLEGHLNASLTQWLEQPAVMPENTLQQASLSSDFSVNSKGIIKHIWKIDDIVDKNNQQIIKSINIDGSAQLHSSTDIEINLPVTMESESGQTFMQIDALATLAGNKLLKLDINGKTIYLNDIFKLIDAISPPEETARKETSEETAQASPQAKPEKPPLNTVVDTQPFWKSAIDIDANLAIDKLYQTNYLAFDQIKGQLSVNELDFKAHNISARFHDSPLKLDSVVDFRPTAKHPYNVDFFLDIKDFDIEKFMRELDPTHEPRIAGIFNVDFKVFGEIDNTDQIRNQLMFDTRLVSYDGIFHFIPKTSVLLLSSGYAMAVAGEVVSVLPTAGFGLGIMSRMVRFIKDLPYDKIDIHLVRKADKNTDIEHFELFSPQLYMNARGEITFVENTRVFDQPLDMTARLDLAGEGAAIFYGMDLLTGKKNTYGFWTGPEIKFGGTLNHPTDNFEEIVQAAKKGTVQGGITRPFSGIIGDFKYRWFGGKPDYREAVEQPSATGSMKPVDSEPPDKTESKQTDTKSTAPVKPRPVENLFF